MKSKFTLAALALLATATLSISCTEKSTAATSVNRNINGNFSGIILSGNANVILTQGETNSVRVEGDEQNTREVETRVSDGALLIYSGVLRNVTVYVTMSDISLIQINGNGIIKASNIINSDVLLLKINGSGTINADVRALSVGMIVNGNGKIIARGSAGDSFIRVTGSGQVFASSLASVAQRVEENSTSGFAVNN